MNPRICQAFLTELDWQSFLYSYLFQYSWMQDFFSLRKFLSILKVHGLHHLYFPIVSEWASNGMVAFFCFISQLYHMILKISDFSPLLQTMLAAKNKMRRDSLHTCKSFCYWVRILVGVLVFLPEGHRIIICHEKKTIHKEPKGIPVYTWPSPFVVFIPWDASLCFDDGRQGPEHTSMNYVSELWIVNHLVICSEFAESSVSGFCVAWWKWGDGYDIYVEFYVSLCSRDENLALESSVNYVSNSLWDLRVINHLVFALRGAGFWC